MPSWPSSLVLCLALVAGSCGGSGGSPDETDAGDDAAFGLPDAGTPGNRRACREAAQILPYARRVSDVLVVFDRSASMNAEFGAGTRLSVETEILADLIAAYDDKIHFGFQVFPSRAGCLPGIFSGCCTDWPLVGVAPGSAGAVIAAMKAAEPAEGNTPTAAALRFARDYYATLRDNVSGRYVLLSTDGRPTCAAGGALGDADVFDGAGRRIAGACYDAVAEIDRLVAGGVKVIVLGVGPGLASDPGKPAACLEEMAAHGGAMNASGKPAFFPGTDPAELESALQQVFGAVTRPGCTVELDALPADSSDVAVFLDDYEIPRDRVHGWDYATPQDARRIRVFGEYCRRLERFQVTTLEVHFGCPPCRPGERCVEPVLGPRD